MAHFQEIELKSQRSKSEHGKIKKNFLIGNLLHYIMNFAQSSSSSSLSSDSFCPSYDSSK